MKKELCTIKTEKLAEALADARELETRLSGVFSQFGGINIRSIIRLIHDFGTQVNVNGDLFWEQSLYADSPDFHWDGTPGKVDSIRLLEYKHIAYINIRPLAGDRTRYITSFDIGYETDEEPSAGEVTESDIVEELNARKPKVPPEIVKKATELFAELKDLVTSNNFSLCFDEDTDCLFIGPNKIAWNVDKPSEKYGDPSVRKPVTSDMIDRYSKAAHIATEPIVFMHSTDSDDTFARCGLTYLP